MKKIFLFFLLLCLTANAQIINIPDANFKALLLTSSPSNTIAKDLTGNNIAIDANSDGEIQQSEANQIGTLSFYNDDPNDPNFTGNNPIQDYEGILSFTNIKTLNISSWNVPSTPLVLNNLNALETLGINFNNSDLGTVSVTNCPLLKNLSIEGIEVISLSGLSLIENLKLGNYFSLSQNALDDIENMAQLKSLEFNGYGNQTLGFALNLSGHSNLLNLKILHTSLDINVSNCALLQNITLDSNYIPSNSNSTTVNINSSNCPNLTNYNVSQTGNVEANIISHNCPALINFISVNAGGGSLSFNDCVNLEIIDVRNLTSLSVNNCTHLDKIKALRFNGSALDLSNSNLQNLKYLEIGYVPAFNLPGNNNGPLTSLNVQGITSLLELHCFYHQISNLNVQGCPNLKIIDCKNNLLTVFDTPLPALKSLNILRNDLTSFNINDYPNLEYLDIVNNKIVDLDISNHQKIQELWLWNDPMSFPPSSNSGYLKTVNANNCTGLNQVIIDNVDNIEKVFIKNGLTDNISILSCPNLQYMCCDDSEVTTVQNMLTSSGITNCNLNTYCSFVPGGNYNTITGTVRFDENNNGCDTNDEVFEHMKLKINDGTNTGETFVKNNGKYDFYTQAGTFTVTAEPENPALFTVTPSTFNTSFANNNNNIFTQNICVTKNTNANDLEVVIAPVTNAVPGFDALYKLMWRNKGNTTLSGNVILTFDSSKMTLMSSSLPYTSAIGNQITFNFSGLKPYANTASEIVFKINTPTHPTNPVNSGNTLNFSAVINPLPGDIKPEDNSFIYNQIVVNSMDPNDIVCIEGNYIPQSMVGKFLHYIVNFENTGTAPATNIVVEMDIDPNDLDISTLQLQNASHRVYTRVRDHKVEFIMENANLGNGGHGNVLLKIASKSNLSGGDSISNKANIYFDYNFPVVTNDAITNIEGALNVTETKKDDSITLYPIPTKGDVNINADSKIISVEVYDGQGRIIQKQIGINSSNTKVVIRNNVSGTLYFKIITEKGSMMKKVIKN